VYVTTADADIARAEHHEEREVRGHDSGSLGRILLAGENKATLERFETICFVWMREDVVKLRIVGDECQGNDDRSG
jgi:hypothetical protein